MTKRFYSFSVHSPGEIPLEAQRVILEPGLNAFTATLEDVDSFTTMLREEGVTTVQVNCLDEHELVSPGLEGSGHDLNALRTGDD